MAKYYKILGFTQIQDKVFSLPTSREKTKLLLDSSTSWGLLSSIFNPGLRAETGVQLPPAPGQYGLFGGVGREWGAATGARGRGKAARGHMEKSGHPVGHVAGGKCSQEGIGGRGGGLALHLLPLHSVPQQWREEI